jgi:hypothetical protein
MHHIASVIIMRPRYAGAAELLSIVEDSWGTIPAIVQVDNDSAHYFLCMLTQFLGLHHQDFWPWCEAVHLVGR